MSISGEGGLNAEIDMESKSTKYEPIYASKISAEEAEKIRKRTGIKVSGLTTRRAKAIIADNKKIRRGGYLRLASDNQVAKLKRFGYSEPMTFQYAQALLGDIEESLNFEVIRFEGLLEAEMVVHVNSKGTPRSVIMPDRSFRLKCSEQDKPFSSRHLRRYRSDGDYSKTEIPSHYFENGWLRRW